MELLIKDLSANDLSQITLSCAAFIDANSIKKVKEARCIVLSFALHSKSVGVAPIAEYKPITSKRYALVLGSA